MRILHLNNEKTWRGGERQTLLLASGLADLGIDGAIACRPGAPLWEEARQVNVPVVPLAGGAVTAIPQLIFQTRRYDLLHCETGRTHSLAAIIARWHGKPVVVSRRMDFSLRQSQFTRFKYATAAKIVVISQFIATQMQNFGVPAQRLTIIPDAVPAFPPTTPQQIQELRAMLRLPANKKVIGNIAALDSFKDQATLLRAARIVTGQRADVCFVIIGAGELRAELLRLRAELGLTDTVLFAGFLPQAHRYMPAFDVFVLSSRMEGLGTSILDAFAAGVPVAATAAGGIPDIVRSGSTGLLAPVGDAAELASAVLKLLAEPALANRLSATAQTLVATEYAVKKMAERYLAVYEEVLASP